jgi:hypothetical protein
VARRRISELNFIFEQRFGNPAAAANEQHLSIQSFASKYAGRLCAPERRAAATERGVSNPNWGSTNSRWCITP